MINELIFLLHCSCISLFALGALWLGREALVGFICLQAILANLFVVKQITLLGLNATASDAFTVGGVLGLNLLQEYYGQDEAKKAIWISFFMLVFYGIVSQIHLAYIPSSFDTMQTHFAPILGFMPRIVIASFTVYLIAQHLDALLYGYFKKMAQGRYLIIRNYGSIVISQLVDTVLFSVLGLYGIVDNVLHIIIVSYAIKLATIMVATPFIGLSKKLM